MWLTIECKFVNYFIEGKVPRWQFELGENVIFGKLDLIGQIKKRLFRGLWGLWRL